jgi:hypothetical protein
MFNTSEIASGIVALIFILALLVGAFVGVKNLIKIALDMSKHHLYYRQKGKAYKVRKTVISADICLILYITCLVLYNPLKMVLPSFNILTIWLFLSAIGILLWNGNDIIKGFNYR